jgi:hypothetical protein
MIKVERRQQKTNSFSFRVQRFAEFFFPVVFGMNFYRVFSAIEEEKKSCCFDEKKIC